MGLIPSDEESRSNNEQRNECQKYQIHDAEPTSLGEEVFVVGRATKSAPCEVGNEEHAGDGAQKRNGRGHESLARARQLNSSDEKGKSNTKNEHGQRDTVIDDGLNRRYGGPSLTPGGYPPLSHFPGDLRQIGNDRARMRQAHSSKTVSTANVRREVGREGARDVQKKRA